MFEGTGPQATAAGSARSGRKRIAIATGLLSGFLILGIVGGGHAPNGHAQNGPRGENAGPGPGSMHGSGSPMGNVEPHFIQEMIPHHEDAVVMADLALVQAEHLELRQLAQAIKRVQTEEIDTMRSWYQAWYGTEVPPSMMGGAMPMMGGHDPVALDGARPFDKAFIEQMIPHHEMAVMMSRMALRRAERPELRELLQSIVVSQSAEIEQMRTWYAAWYGGSVPSHASGPLGGHRMDGSETCGGTGPHHSGMEEHRMGNSTHSQHHRSMQPGR